MSDYRDESGALAGYLVKGKLQNGKSKDLGWRLHREVTRYTIPPEYDTAFAVILVKETKQGLQYAGGYSFGEGMLFRGEKVPGRAKWGTRAEAELVKDAKDIALAESEYWMRRDEEARQDDERALAQEQELEEEGFFDRDPRRKRRRKRARKRARRTRR